MGIHGLWRLLEPTGRDVTLESLENKVLAIDVSLWLYQAQQGSAYGGSTGANAHLLTLFHRISKLLFYRVKPVFVFDGDAPGLKKKTIFARKQKKQVARDRAEEMRQQLFLSLAKSGVVDPAYIQAQASTAGPSPKKVTPKKKNAAEVDEEDLYKLPPIPKTASADQEDGCSEESSLSDDDDRAMSYYDSDEDSKSSAKGAYKAKGKVEGGWKKWNSWVDPHEVDLQSEGFKILPVEVRREILTDLKEARKESSWGRLHKMPKDLGNFSSFQMSRLLHRRKVQEVLEKVEEEISKSEARGTSLGELEAMLVEKGVAIELQSSQRIASDENKGFILVSGLKDKKKADDTGGEKKPDPSKLDVVKEEPEDFDYDDVNEREFQKLLYESSKSKVASGSECKSEHVVDKNSQSETGDHLASQPTLKEEEMLSSNRIVKKFLMCVTETSNDAQRSLKESGEFESISNALDEESCPDELSQGEIMAMIKNQVSSGKVSSSAKKMDSGKVKVSNDIRPTSKPSLGKDSLVEVIEGFTSGEDENDGLTQEQMMKIMCDQKGSSVDVEVTKVVDAPKKDLGSVSALEQVDKIISNPVTPSGTDDEVTIEKIIGNSESDESDFLEVEDASEKSRPASEHSRANSPEPKEEVETSKTNESSTKLLRDEKLAVVVDLTAKPDIGDDIFADVFDGGEPKKSAESGTKLLTSKVTVEEASVLGAAEEEEGTDDEPSEERDGGVTYIEETSSSEHDDATEELQENIKMVTEDSAKDVEEPVPSEEVAVLTEEDRRKLTLELRKKELEGKAGVTDRARMESQELLGLFGVPWIVAPYEAEAQCAFLESVTFSSPRKGSFSRLLVEGTVTEDSDVWAFGASRVYRHVFDRKRSRVRVYSKEKVERKLGIDRVRMIQLALLTGSDYTEGIPGIGTVSALEILAAFPGDKERHQHSADPDVDAALSGLQHFADWWKRVERNEKEGKPIGHSLHDPPEGVAKALRRRLCSCLKAVDTKQAGGSLLPPGFPSRAVVQAYLKPPVDGCTDAFTWLKPDEAALRSFAHLHFGWTEERINSILRPLFARLKLSDCVDRKQLSINSYFSRVSVAPNVIDVGGSKLGVRTKKALERISGISGEVESSPPKKKGRVAKKASPRAKVQDPVALEDERPISDEDFDTRKSPGKGQRVSPNKERVICDDDYDRREPSGKLELLRKKFSKEMVKVPRVVKPRVSHAVGKAQERIEGKGEEDAPVPPTKEVQVAKKAAEGQVKELLESEEENASSDDDFDMTVSPGKRPPERDAPKYERVICEDDYDLREPTGKLNLLRKKFSKELGKGNAPRATKSSVSPGAGKAQESTVGKCEGGASSTPEESGQASKKVVEDEIKELLAFIEEKGLSDDDDFEAGESPVKQPQPVPMAPAEERVICEDDYDRRDPTGKLELWRKKFAKELAKVKRPRAPKSSKISFGPGPSSKSTSVGVRTQGNRTLVVETGFGSSLYSKDMTPQRKKDHDSALQSRLKAIEVMRKSSIGCGKRAAPRKSSVGRDKKLKREEVHLSESSDSD